MRGDARGTLWLVVGPSGSGKDTLIYGAEDLFAKRGVDNAPVVQRREITRTAGAGGEDSSEVDVATFEERRAAGAYALWWAAHGLFYGVPRSVDDVLGSGRNVILNVSRGVIYTARETLAPMRVLSISVPSDVLRERLAARGRETREDIERRVARAEAFTVEGRDVVPFLNTGPIEQAIAKAAGLFQSRG